ncbi:RNA 2',3'-cyclic phosphodiesterase [Telmatospirillum siberiense]|uniref:RNA 2',3'-cyclic phosphodiesterase n=1 Tax=Telmatospirillum siberiense TaxID=382514 RepID=A0A2N3PST9_9PROT|nr:RNA 2',3'-cyclic phosphodiesterase [Telmatospirillum siberiense]PKU23470.1 RNA 2',3'-cyclic phosphodiesterase [Telmatospirillum siberiense]
MIRLFVGLALPPSLRQTLAMLGGGLPGARWTPPENLHLTLRFIGEIDEAMADDIDGQLAAVRAQAFSLELGGLGTFDSGRRAHHLWIGVKRAPALTHLQEKIESAVVRGGCAPERRHFQPHVTLARLKDPPLGRLQDFIAGHNLFQAELTVSRFTLFSSHLGHGDPVYRAERDYPLDES